ncbi:MAG: hypothetical protein JG775_1895 [Defluviitaleaceae bacterium]|nr:hypothetical protein [Defluviitaleaceae bacterium]
MKGRIVYSCVSERLKDELKDVMIYDDVMDWITILLDWKKFRARFIISPFFYLILHFFFLLLLHNPFFPHQFQDREAE